MRLQNVTVERSDLGWHGIGSAEVIQSKPGNTIVDISIWVDENGIGSSAGGWPVEKRFPSIIVLLDDPVLDRETYARRAAVAFIGTNGVHHGNRYCAEFDDPPMEGQYMAFFPHDVIRRPGERPNVSTIEPIDYSPEEVVEFLKE